MIPVLPQGASLLPVAEITLHQFEIYTIIFFRIAGIVMAMPFFGSENVPRMVRIGLSVVITMALIPTVDIVGVVLPESLVGYVLMVAKELFVGLLLGFVSLLLFNGIQFAGDLLGFQMGLRIGNIIDPLSDEQISVIGKSVEPDGNPYFSGDERGSFPVQDHCRQFSCDSAGWGGI